MDKVAELEKALSEARGKRDKFAAELSAHEARSKELTERRLALIESGSDKPEVKRLRVESLECEDSIFESRALAKRADDEVKRLESEHKAAHREAVLGKVKAIGPAIVAAAERAEASLVAAGRAVALYREKAEESAALTRSIGNPAQDPNIRIENSVLAGLIREGVVDPRAVRGLPLGPFRDRTLGDVEREFQGLPNSATDRKHREAEAEARSEQARRPVALEAARQRLEQKVEEWTENLSKHGGKAAAERLAEHRGELDRVQAEIAALNKATESGELSDTLGA